MQRLQNHSMPDRERLELFNQLCKTCSRNRVIPTSMHIPDCSENSVEAESGGFADVSRATYNGRQVAIKVVRAYDSENLDEVRSVSGLPPSLYPPRRTDYRGSVGRELLGNTSGIPISYHCLV